MKDDGFRTILYASIWLQSLAKDSPFSITVFCDREADADRRALSWCRFQAELASQVFGPLAHGH
jgi:hypothetical protein